MPPQRTMSGRWSPPVVSDEERALVALVKTYRALGVEINPTLVAALSFAICHWPRVMADPPPAQERRAA
jgi:hypothetical protein